MCYRGFGVLRGQVRPAEAKTRNLARLSALDSRGIKESDGLGYSLVPVSHQLCDPLASVLCVSEPVPSV